MSSPSALPLSFLRISAAVRLIGSVSTHTGIYINAMFFYLVLGVESLFPHIFIYYDRNLLTLHPQQQYIYMVAFPCSHCKGCA